MTLGMVSRPFVYRSRPDPQWWVVLCPDEDDDAKFLDWQHAYHYATTGKVIGFCLKMSGVE